MFVYVYMYYTYMMVLIFDLKRCKVKLLLHGVDGGFIRVLWFPPTIKTDHDITDVLLELLIIHMYHIYGFIYVIIPSY